MDHRTWLPPVVFIGTAVPAVLLLHAFDIGGEFRVFIAIAVGVLATAITMSRMAQRKDDPPDS